MVHLIFNIILCGLALLCLVYAGAVKIRSIRLTERLERMIQAALSGTFVEQQFDESRLSKLETMLYHLLSARESEKNAQTREKDRIKELISDISHQTKTPVSNIKLYAELLLEQAHLDEDTRSLAKQIQFQADKLGFLTGALIKTSRLESGIIAVKPVRQDVQPMLEELNRQYAPMAEAAQIFLSLSAGPAAALFDKKWTAEAIGNILDNAVKYTSPGGNIKVSLREYESFVCISVSDTGMGIKEEECPKIFSRFYRSPDAADRQGVGIGLYLTREIISKEGGYVTVKSKYGNGTAFSVFLAKRESL